MPAGSVTRRDVFIFEPAGLGGQVRDLAGGPVGLARVKVYDSTSGDLLASVRSDTNRAGNYVVKNISAWGGVVVAVRATKSGWRSGWVGETPPSPEAPCPFWTPMVQPGDELRRSSGYPRIPDMTLRRR